LPESKASGTFAFLMSSRMHELHSESCFTDTSSAEEHIR
jgi:hypothetical protein